MSRNKPSLARLIAIASVLVLAVAGAGWWLFQDAGQRRITAYFAAAVGLYPKGDVRILGVPVGTIEEVVPSGKLVRVEMTVDREVRVPADAVAVAVAPSIVSDRYVQLAPVYKGGPELEDGAVIPQERTATPVELDQIYRSLNELTTALGPNGANSNGELSELLDTAAQNLDGNGEALSETIRNFGELSSTLSGDSEELFATVDNLQKFTEMLARNDDEVRQFAGQMQEVSALLADERQNLSAAMAELAVALGKVEKFVRDNRGKLQSNVEQLTAVTTVLVKQKAALKEALSTAPLALGNLNHSYNGASGTLDTRAVINELNQPPLVAVCQLLQNASPAEIPGDVAGACESLQGVLDGVVELPTPAEVVGSLEKGELPPLPLPLSTPDSGQPAGGGR
ncbi:MAG: MCE family protein [Saccharopolyspora rectivirgula]